MLCPCCKNQNNIKPENKVVLEGKDVVVKITASEKCFVSEVGDYDYCTNINLGPAIIDESDNELKVREIECYVYLDSIGISRKIVFSPEVWGIRTQDEQRDAWSKEKNIILNILKPAMTKVAVYTTSPINAFVNGRNQQFLSGMNELEYLPIIGTIKRKSELVITYDRYTEKVVLACNPSCTFSEVIIDKDVEVAVKYAGPEMQKITIRTFIDGFRNSQMEKTASRSRAIFNISVGEAWKLNGKRVVVDVCTSKSGIPIKIFDQVIEIEEQTDMEEPTSVTENNQAISRLSDYVNVRELLNYYYKNVSSGKNIDLARILEWIKEEK